MRLKLPPFFKRCAIVMVICFIIGFVVAILLAPSPEAKTGGSNYSLLKEAGQAAPSQSFSEKEDPSYLGIIIAIFVIALIVSYGYYREKRKKTSS